MTLFDKNAQHGGDRHHQTSSPTIEEGKYHEALVGEGKKFKDIEALAKGKVESDNYIARLEAELEEARGTIQTKLSLEEMMAEIKANIGNAPSNSAPPQPNEPAPQQSGNGLTQEQLEALLEQKLNQRQALTQAQQNQETVKRELVKAWGANAQSQLRDVAKALDMSETEMDALASRNPKAFLKLVGADTKSTNGDFTPPRSTVASTPGTSGKKNYAYFQKMLRENPSQYHNKSTQQEMYKLAMTMGADFYS